MHVGTLEVYKCKRRVGVGMYTICVYIYIVMLSLLL